MHAVEPQTMDMQATVAAAQLLLVAPHASPRRKLPLQGRIQRQANVQCMTVLLTVYMPVCLQARAAAALLLLVAPYASHWRIITLQRRNQRQASHLAASCAAYGSTSGHHSDRDANAVLRTRVGSLLLLHHSFG